MKTPKLTMADRSEWIDNLEVLYTWWQSSKISKRAFIRLNKEAIDAAIYLELNKEPMR